MDVASRGLGNAQLTQNHELTEAIASEPLLLCFVIELVPELDGDLVISEGKELLA